LAAFTRKYILCSKFSDDENCTNFFLIFQQVLS
jgi:hypothetical protein